MLHSFVKLIDCNNFKKGMIESLNGNFRGDNEVNLGDIPSYACVGTSFLPFIPCLAK